MSAIHPLRTLAISQLAVFQLSSMCGLDRSHSRTKIRDCLAEAFLSLIHGSVERFASHCGSEGMRQSGKG